MLRPGQMVEQPGLQRVLDIIPAVIDAERANREYPEGEGTSRSGASAKGRDGHVEDKPIAWSIRSIQR